MSDTDKMARGILALAGCATIVMLLLLSAAGALGVIWLAQQVLG